MQRYLSTDHLPLPFEEDWLLPSNPHFTVQKGRLVNLTPRYCIVVRYVIMDSFADFSFFGLSLISSQFQQVPALLIFSSTPSRPPLTHGSLRLSLWCCFVCSIPSSYVILGCGVKPALTLAVFLCVVVPGSESSSTTPSFSASWASISSPRALLSSETLPQRYLLTGSLSLRYAPDDSRHWFSENTHSKGTLLQRTSS